MIYLIVIPWAQVVCLIYTPEARGPQARGCIYQANHECTWYNCYMPLCTNCAWASAKQLKPMQYKNGFIVFIVAPIEFDYGFEVERLYYVLTHHE